MSASRQAEEPYLQYAARTLERELERLRGALEKAQRALVLAEHALNNCPFSNPPERRAEHEEALGEVRECWREIGEALK